MFKIEICGKSGRVGKKKFYETHETFLRYLKHHRSVGYYVIKGYKLRKDKWVRYDPETP